MKIEGETIRKAADQAQGLGQTVEPALRATSNVMGEVGRRLAHPMSRKARLVEFKEAKFENADDWTAAEDGAVTVNASVTGGTTIDLSETIEFIHYGRVYLDRSHLFPSPKLDDTAAQIVAPQVVTPQNGATPNPATPGRDIPARGLMYRAALMREAVLLGGFIRAQMDALTAEEKSKGVIGVLAQVLADMTGSAGGTQDKPNPVDLNPHLKKVIEAVKRVNKDKVDYVALHAAGIELHVARRAYREYLVSEIEKRNAPAKSPGGGVLNDQVGAVNESLAAGHEWLGDKKKQEQKKDVVPKLTAIVPPGVQDFLSLVQKISFKAWDITALLNYEYATRLEPIIEDSARRMTVDAVQRRSAPIFPVWYLAPQPDYQLPADVEQKIFDKIDNPISKKNLPGLLGGLVGPINQAVDVVTDPIKAALHQFDQNVGIDKTLDFLSRPDRYTPGRPFLDDIFLIPSDPDAPEVPDGARRARVGWSSGLGQMAVDVLKASLGIQRIPAFLEWVISRVSTVCAEFIRGIYSKLLTLQDTDQVTEAEFHEAAKRHLVGNVIETILGGLRFADKLRKITVDIPIAEVAISVDALIGRAKEFASQKLEQYIAPVIKYAMRDMFGLVMAHRKTAIQNRANTMEVHLAQLPTVFARMFRNVFFPLWDKVIEKTIEAVSASLMPRIVEAGQSILKARAQVEQVRGKIVQSLAALDTLPAALPDVGFNIKDPKGSVEKLKKDWNPIAKNAKDAFDNAELDVTQDLPLEGDAVETGFPIHHRIKQVELLKVTPEHLKLVSRELKWKKLLLQGTGEEASGGSDLAPGEVANNASGGPSGHAQGATGKAGGNGGSGSSPPPSSQSFGYGNYPLSSPAPQPMMYAGQAPGAPGGGPDYAPPSSSPSSQLYLASAPPAKSLAGLPQGAPQLPTAAQGQLPTAGQGLHSPSLTAGVPDSFNAEQTMDLGNVISPELREQFAFDAEETAALDGPLPDLGPSGLPPFLGPNKKA